MNTSAKDPLSNIVDSLTEFLGFWGFTELQARLWAILFLSTKALGVEQLGKITNCSEEEVLSSLDELKKFHLVKPIDASLKTFTTNEDIMSCIRMVIKMREIPLLESIKSMAKNLVIEDIKEPAFPVSEKSIESLAKMTKTAESFLKALLAIGSLQLPKLRNPFSK
jgi:DNA-binding transcriptional regulator GbsR (MarR family)